MMRLAEYRSTASLLADFLPWAALVAEGVILNKDGSLQRTARFRGPDLDSATPSELVAVSGRLAAEIVQTCGVSGEDFPVRIEEPIALRFVPEVVRSVPDEEIELEEAELDEIEYSGDAFDLGEAIAQTLGLAIDPYAEGPNADAASREAGIISDEAPSGPLADALRKLRDG